MAEGDRADLILGVNEPAISSQDIESSDAVDPSNMVDSDQVAEVTNSDLTKQSNGASVAVEDSAANVSTELQISTDSGAGNQADTSTGTANGPITSSARAVSSTATTIASSINDTSLSLQERTTPFEQALKAWRDINFSELQKHLDNQGLEIVENQKISVVGRKELAAKTKEFRRLPDDEKLLEIRSLLKAYQTEIDNLTKRGKSAESAFLNMYRVLAEAPDPYPLLEATLESILAAEELSALSTENSKLKSQLQKYSDYDDLRAKLVKAEQKVGEVSAAKVAAKEVELQALLDEKERNWKLREEDLNRQVHEARELIRELRATHAVTEARLVQHEQKLDENIDGRFAEAEIIAADLERVNLRALQTERRNLELRQELERLKSSIGMSGEPSMDDQSNIRQRMETLKDENSALGRKIEAIREEARVAKEASAKRIAQLERDNTRKQSEIGELKNKLRTMADYEDIKHELGILKFVEFSAEIEDDGEDDFDNSAKVKHQTDSLEQLLLSRNRKLTNELTNLRVSHDSLQKQLKELENNFKVTTTALESSKQLNQKLEEDLAVFHESVGSNTGGNSYAASRRSGRGADTVSLIGGSLRAGLTSVVPALSIDDNESTRSGALTPGGRSIDQHMSDLTILPIITQQRDRFRARNAELEQELRSEYSKISEMRAQIETLQRDNLALYEKTRYLSTYRTSAVSSVGSGGESGGISGTYRNQYEEHISPFAQFRGREQERALSRMGPVERVIYGLSRVALANKTSRNLFFAYITGLHLFLMGTIWYLALGELGRHDSIGSSPGMPINDPSAAGIPPAAVIDTSDGPAALDGKWVLAKPQENLAAVTTQVATAIATAVAQQMMP
ncbi:CASP C terminal-domain-containing protein [Dipodascopsis uninucleata]